MNNFGKKVLAILAVFCLLLQFFAGTPEAQAAGQDRYGYSLLINEEQRNAYKKVAEGIGAYRTEIVFDMSSTTAQTLDNVSVAVRMVFLDYPEYFWFSGGGNVSLQGSTVTVKPEAYRVNGKTADTNQIAAAKKELDAVIAQAKARIPSGASDYKKSEIIHDFVDDRTQYRMTGDHQSAYGALVLGNAVCAGYTRAYQLLMQAVGIPCWYVSGQSYAPDGSLVRHAWNLVWLDGKCCYTDVTWDDHSPTNFHHYLNLSLEQISADHFPDKLDIDGDGKGDGTFLPAACGHTAYTYFKQNGATGSGICDMTGKETGEQIAKYFVLQSKNGNQVSYFCRIHYHGADGFDQWFSRNALSVAGALKLSGSIQIQQEILGLEYQVTMTGTATNEQPTEPKPTEPKPTEPKPTEPKPTEPKPTEPKPTEPKPTEPKPTEPKPTEPKPTEPQPTEPMPTDPRPTEPQPTEPMPTDPRPTDPQPTEPQPTGPKPTEPKPTNPVQSQPVQEDSGTADSREPNGGTTADTAGSAPDENGQSKNPAAKYVIFGAVGGGSLIAISLVIGFLKKRRH